MNEVEQLDSPVNVPFSMSAEEIGTNAKSPPDNQWELLKERLEKLPLAPIGKRPKPRPWVLRRIVFELRLVFVEACKFLCRPVRRLGDRLRCWCSPDP